MKHLQLILFDKVAELVVRTLKIQNTQGALQLPTIGTLFGFLLFSPCKVSFLSVKIGDNSFNKKNASVSNYHFKLASLVPVQVKYIESDNCWLMLVG